MRKIKSQKIRGAGKVVTGLLIGSVFGATVYNLSESGPAGYTAGAWAWKGAQQVHRAHGWLALGLRVELGRVEPVTLQAHEGEEGVADLALLRPCRGVHYAGGNHGIRAGA